MRAQMSAAPPGAKVTTIRIAEAGDVDGYHRAVEERIVADRPAFQVRRDARMRQQQTGQALDHERQAGALGAAQWQQRLDRLRIGGVAALLVEAPADRD